MLSATTHRSSAVMLTVAVIFLASGAANSEPIFHKCCDDGFVLDDELQCSIIQDTQSVFQVIHKTVLEHAVCSRNSTLSKSTKSTPNSSEPFCQGFNHNGTLLTLSCKVVKPQKNLVQGCDSILTALDFYGATIIVGATSLYTIPYLLVIAIYFSLAELRVRAYDRSVLAFNVSYVILNADLIFLGAHELCHKTLPEIVYALLGLVLIYLTQSCCLWLLVICLDMTSVITRFHWSPGEVKRQNERQKFRVYSFWVWPLSSIPTIFAAIAEFNSFLPSDSILRPGLGNFHGQHGPAILFYTLLLPVAALFINTGLFCYTTYRIIKIRKDNAILNRGSETKDAKKKYFLFLKLYLIMDAPWLSGALSAIFPSLWWMKFFRIVQPILMLIVIVPRKRIVAAFGCLKKASERFRRLPVFSPAYSEAAERLNCPEKSEARAQPDLKRQCQFYDSEETV